MHEIVSHFHLWFAGKDSLFVSLGGRGMAPWLYGARFWSFQRQQSTICEQCVHLGNVVDLVSRHHAADDANTSCGASLFLYLSFAKLRIRPLANDDLSFLVVTTATPSCGNISTRMDIIPTPMNMN